MYTQETISVDAFSNISSVVLSPSDGAPADFTAAQAIDVCANLVIRRRESFEFSHLSVREFLEGLEHRKIDAFFSEGSNAFIAQSCLRYLTYKIGVEMATDAPEDPLEVETGETKSAGVEVEEYSGEQGDGSTGALSISKENVDLEDNVASRFLERVARTLIDEDRGAGYLFRC